MTTLQFILPSNPGCAPLVCGVDNNVFLPLKTASTAKSADGSGYLYGTITATEQLSLTSWRYTVEVEDSEIAGGETVTGDDMQGQVCCISGSDAALLAKVNNLAPDAITPLSWQSFALYGEGDAVLTALSYLFRRHTGFKIHAIEAAIVSGQGPVSIQLQKTAANGTAYSTNILDPVTVTGSGVYTGRYAPPSPVTVNAFEAIRASITGAASIYEATAYGLELHLLTSEL